MSALKKGSRAKSLSLSDDFPLKSAYRKKSSNPGRLEDMLKIMKYIDENVIGKSAPFLGPFGRRRGEEFIIKVSFLFNNQWKQ